MAILDGNDLTESGFDILYVFRIEALHRPVTDHGIVNLGPFVDLRQDAVEVFENRSQIGARAQVFVDGQNPLLWI